MLSCLPTKHIFVEDQGHHSAQKNGKTMAISSQCTCREQQRPVICSQSRMELPFHMFSQWEFQDPKLEVLYQGHILGGYPLT